MLRAITLGLAIGTAAAATVSGPAGALNTTETASQQLEQMVSNMAEGQEHAATAPTPKFLNAEQEVVILEEEEARQSHGRALAVCNCAAYMNGAQPGNPLCFKRVGSNRICYPQTFDGRCEDTLWTSCTDGPQPSPNAAPIAEVDKFTSYLNARITLRVAGDIPTHQLPTAAQFTTALATYTQLKEKRINVITSGTNDDTMRGNAATSIVRSISPGRRLGKMGGSGSSTEVVMFATLAAKGANRRDALNAQLQAMEELPEIDGRSYVVKHLTVTEQSDQPMVCTPQAESLKAEAAALLAELVQLQQEALALVKGSLELAKANCDGATMLAIENALGVPSAGP